jgi:hypothetical protein
MGIMRKQIHLGSIKQGGRFPEHTQAAIAVAAKQAANAFRVMVMVYVEQLALECLLANRTGAALQEKEPIINIFRYAVITLQRILPFPLFISRPLLASLRILRISGSNFRIGVIAFVSLLFSAASSLSLAIDRISLVRAQLALITAAKLQTLAFVKVRQRLFFSAYCAASLRYDFVSHSESRSIRDELWLGSFAA